MRRLSILLFIFTLVGCHKPDPNMLTIGTIAGPETELVEVAKDVAQKQYGLNIKIVEFNDYNLPNEALQDGSLDANIYQHLPYLDAAIKARGYDLVPLSKTFVYPMAIYSNKHHSIAKIPTGGIIAIPNDPSNGARALILLAKSGLISMKKTNLPSIADITNNPKHLVIKELDAAQLPRVLADVDAAIINTNFAVLANLSPSHDAIFMEGKDSPYANLIVIRKDTKKKTQLEQFVKAFHSQTVKNKAKALFGDAAIPAW